MAKARGDSAARVYQTLPLAAPTGGMDLRTSLTQMGEDRARLAVNVSLAEPGVFASRLGYRVLTTDTGGFLPPPRIQGGLRAYFRTSTPSAWSRMPPLLPSKPATRSSIRRSASPPSAI